MPGSHPYSRSARCRTWGLRLESTFGRRGVPAKVPGIPSSGIPLSLLNKNIPLSNPTTRNNYCEISLIFSRIIAVEVMKEF